MKKGVSLFESMFCFIFYGVLISVLVLNLISIHAFVGCLILISFGILSMYVYIITLSWRGLPKGCMYNPTGFVEIHIENICAGSRTKFMKLCLDALLYGVKNRKNIMIDTWLIRENHIKELFGCAARIYKPSIAQNLVNSIFMLVYKNKTKRKCFHCVIYIDRLSEEQRENIINHIIKLQSTLK